MNENADRTIQIGPPEIAVMRPIQIVITHSRNDQSTTHLSFTEARTLLTMLYDELAGRAPELLDEVYLMPKPAAADAVATAWDQGAVAEANRWIREPVNPYRTTDGVSS